MGMVSRRRTKLAANPYTAWQKILQLGEQLNQLLPELHKTSLEEASSGITDHFLYSLLAQQELIIQTVEDILGGKVGLWIIQWSDLDTLSLQRSTLIAQAVQRGVFSPEPPSALIHQAFTTQQTCYYSNKTGLDAGLAKATLLATPLLNGAAGSLNTTVLGVLTLEKSSGAIISPAENSLMEGLAALIAAALQNSRKLYVEHRRLDKFSVIFEISRVITSILDQDILLNEVVNLIQKRFSYPVVNIFTVHTSQRKIFYEAGAGPHGPRLRQHEFAFNLDDTEGIIPWVAQHGKTCLVNNLINPPRYQPADFYSEEMRSELAIPLIFGGEVLGILDVQNDYVDAFNEEDHFLFDALADNVSIALHNANLYRSEQWRRQVAESLREVAGLLSANADLAQVLQAILTELERTLPCDLVAIWLLDEFTIETSSGGALPSLRLAANSGVDAALLNLEIGSSYNEVLLANDIENQLPADKHPSIWYTEAIKADGPQIRQPNSPYDPILAELDYPADYSAIATPLRVGEQHLGVLILMHHTPGRYGTEASTMTAAFASYAAVAIENTRLFEAAHEQAWISTVLLQVSEATQSVTDLKELLDTVSSITPKLVGVKACLLYILDEDERLVPAACSGLTAEQQSEFERRSFMPGQVPALDHLLNDRHPLIRHHQDEDHQLFEILTLGIETESPYKVELLLMVPMIARGEILGALLVNYSHNQADKNSLVTLEELFRERLTIIQGIAHQTATAVENIRLIKSQREEAYVSVALLQVAQAVVSGSVLEDVLGSIARITPILIGVKRAVIFLWDEQNQLFHLGQSYGLPRSQTALSYQPRDFPLLSAVRTEACLLVRPVSTDSNSPGDIIDAWRKLEPPEPSDLEGYIASEARLLLAFPLSVKSEVLGVFIIEEPEPVPVAGVLNPNSNRRLREKRLEITTGISQQAAMAIQNDQFQRERVGRERLEREMQLAHEIQRAFLPHEIPQLPGWELGVRWVTAREVGGDFYDFFKLPGNRLGLVIADVADKGIPAALFMTLSRTLVRATVQEIEPPAEVLARVNDLLAADAQKGMFVTLIYAVLDLDTGKLNYANAGHNLPILVKVQKRELEILPKGGIALGIFEGAKYREYKFTLEPGDYLIFYTDGITEAFSPQDTMYGETSLYQTVREAIFGNGASVNEPEVEATHLAIAPPPSAQEILDTIDQSVSAFIQDAPRSDDVTLLVIRRTG